MKDNKINTVYASFVQEDKYQKLDGMKPSDMLNLMYIIGEHNPWVVEWRLHHHHRNEFDLALANASMKLNEYI